MIFKPVVMFFGSPTNIRLPAGSEIFFFWALASSWTEHRIQDREGGEDDKETCNPKRKREDDTLLAGFSLPPFCVLYEGVLHLPAMT
jgi:hypothetical protein